MDKSTFNIPQYNSIIDNALKDYNSEIQELNKEQKRLTEKMNLLEWSKECVGSIQQKLSEAYTKINSQENDIESLIQQLTEAQQQRDRYKAMNARIMDVTTENANLNIQLTAQRELFETTAQQLVEEKRLRAEAEMRMAELNKLSSDVAKKSSEEALLKALRTYVSNSKRKRPDKRAAAKEAALDMVLANKLTLPEDLAAAIESLDDDQTEPKVVNVGNGGHYNDIHDNGGVTVKG